MRLAKLPMGKTFDISVVSGCVDGDGDNDGNKGMRIADARNKIVEISFFRNNFP